MIKINIRNYGDIRLIGQEMPLIFTALEDEESGVGRTDPVPSPIRLQVGQEEPSACTSIPVVVVLPCDPVMAMLV